MARVALAFTCCCVVSLSTAADVVFNELHYHPPGDRRKEEFIELYNSGLQWVDLEGWSLENGVRFTFGPGTTIAPNGFVVVARDAKALRERRRLPEGAVVVGDFEGRLSNRGDILELRRPDGLRVAWLHYHDGSDRENSVWPRGADGFGPSLELRHAHPDWSRPWFWEASRLPGGTPGEPNSVALETEAAADRSEKERGSGQRLVISEARWVGEKPFVELLAMGSGTVSLDDYSLSVADEGRSAVTLKGSLKRGYHLIEGDLLAPLLVPDEKTPKPRVIYLLHGTGRQRRLVDVLLLAETPPAGSCCRSPEHPGETVVAPKATPGAPNRLSEEAAIVVNEIHYHGLAETGSDEFIELFNRSSDAVELEGWRLQRAVSFEFPAGAKIGPGEYAVVARDPDTVRRRVPEASKGQVFGPWSGQLSNAGETVVLSDGRGQLVDSVPYRDREPWPRAADGDGFSAELRHPDLDNEWGAAWTAGGPDGTPCRKNARSQKHVGPIVAHVWHTPVAPSPQDRVIIHARVLSTRRVSQVALFYRDAAAGGSARKRSMSDKGTQEDGAARDGHFTAVLPKVRAGGIVAFRIAARDSSGGMSQMPSRGDYYVGTAPQAKPARWPTPTYHVLMPPASWSEMRGRGRDLKNPVNCSFVASISGPPLRGFQLPGEHRGTASYRATIRHRGNNSLRPTRNPLDPATGVCPIGST